MLLCLIKSTLPVDSEVKWKQSLSSTACFNHQNVSGPLELLSASAETIISLSSTRKSGNKSGSSLLAAPASSSPLAPTRPLRLTATHLDGPSAPFLVSEEAVRWHSAAGTSPGNKGKRLTPKSKLVLGESQEGNVARVSVVACCLAPRQRLHDCRGSPSFLAPPGWPHVQNAGPGPEHRPRSMLPAVTRTSFASFLRKSAGRKEVF